MCLVYIRFSNVIDLQLVCKILSVSIVWKCFIKKHEFQNMQSISVINLIKGDFWVDLYVFICKDKDAQISRLSQVRQMSLLQETSCREFWLNTVLGDHTPLYFPCIGLWFLISLLSLLLWHRPGRCKARKAYLLSPFEALPVHHGGVMAPGTWGSWSFCTQEKTERCMLVLRLPSPVYFVWHPRPWNGAAHILSGSLKW